MEGIGPGCRSPSTRPIRRQQVRSPARLPNSALQRLLLGARSGQDSAQVLALGFPPVRAGTEARVKRGPGSAPVLEIARIGRAAACTKVPDRMRQAAGTSSIAVTPVLPARACPAECLTDRSAAWALIRCRAAAQAAPRVSRTCPSGCDLNV